MDPGEGDGGADPQSTFQTGAGEGAPGTLENPVLLDPI
jgi:hypothetical protein